MKDMPPSHPHTARALVLLGFLALGAAAGCRTLEELPDRLLDRRTPRERYVDGLAASGLDGTALAGDWLRAAERALAEAPTVAASHAEEGYLTPAEPVAIAYRVPARRGQVIRVEVTLPGDSTTQVFLDAWQAVADTLPPRHVVSADSGARHLEVDPRRDGDYIIRIQPELLRGGRFSVRLEVAPTLAFPVIRGRESDVGSRWGADRDGGARSHQGIDIFAPRGTPVVAARSGVIRRVEETGRGGKVVWLTDDAGNRLYYAHLDSQAVSRGQRVEQGDTLGTVGNTGNAITTPPHLHFGVYRSGEGAVDPWWFVHRPRVNPPRLAADTTRFGDWVRTAAEGILLRSEPDARGTEGSALPRHTAARVVAAVGSWYRVRLPDGAMGYLPAASAEPIEESLGRVEGAPRTQVLANLSTQGHPEAILAAHATSDSLAIHGRFGSYLLVRTESGLSGWVRSDE